MLRRSVSSSRPSHVALLAALCLPLAVGCGDDTESPGTGAAASAGASGTAGTGGTAGTSGTAGTGGTAGSGGTAGTAGTGGSGGTGGAGGTAGSGGTAGNVAAPGIQLVDIAMAVDLTPDGSIALLEDIASAEGDVYFFDTIQNTLVKKTSIGDPLLNLATGISAQGRVTALHGTPAQAGVWSEANDWTDIPSPFSTSCDPNVGGSWDISADGSVVVGFMWNGCSPQAFRWVDSGGSGTLTKLQLLGSPYPGSSNPPTNRATVVSDDGSTAAGFAQTEVVDRSPAIWKADGTGFMLDETNETPGEILSISADGKTVAGIWGFDGFVWTEATGVVMLPRPASALPDDKMFPNAIAADGKLVFGTVGDAFSGVPVAVVWTTADGARPLKDIATAQNITVPDEFVLTGVLAASTDGTVILGIAQDPSMYTKAFVLRVPASAYGL